MATKIIDKEFEDSEGTVFAIQFNTLGAQKAFKLKIQLMQYMLPALGALGKNFGGIMKAVKEAKAKGEGAFGADINIDFSLVVENLVNKMSPKDFLKFVTDLLENVTVTGGTGQNKVDHLNLSSAGAFDEFFSGEFGLLYAIVGAVLEANFGSLFGKSGTGGLKGLFSSAQKKAQTIIE